LSVSRLLLSKRFFFGVLLSAGVSLFIVQVLPAYPFYYSLPYSIFAPLVDYIELGAILSPLSFFYWKKFQGISTRNSLSATAMVFGGIGAVALIGEQMVWRLVPNGGGYPWLMERVAPNTCFWKAPDFSFVSPNCYFLNYGELLVVAIVVGLAGFMFSRPEPVLDSSDESLNRITPYKDTKRSGQMEMEESGI